MKTTLWIVTALVLLVVGFAAGFPVGKSVGFTTGSEWALVQADILAREAGVFMPVYLNDGNFRVVIKQPRNLYKRAWKLADRHDDRTGGSLNVVRLPGLDEQSAWSGGRRIGLVSSTDLGIR
ncbi:MAG: hypothetical protein ACM3MD_11815 [Betaproteobacteria bacterium]